MVSKKRVLRRVFGARKRRELKRSGRKMHDEHKHGSHSRFQILELRNMLSRIIQVKFVSGIFFSFVCRPDTALPRGDSW